jgi:predicted MFS family arabinose efflux permease
LRSVRDILGRRETVLSLLMVGCSMMASFLIIPNFAAYMLYNCHVPRSNMEPLYAVGGICSFVTMRLVGRLVDRFGGPALSACGTLLFIVNLFAGFFFERLLLPAAAVMALFMTSQSVRNIAATTQLSQVPLDCERARYQSLQSAAQHIASAAGAVVGSLLLSEQLDHRLTGISRLALLSMLFAALNPLILVLIKRQLKRRAVAVAAAGSA